MADVVNVGITDNDGNGDTLRAAFSQINTRFNELLGTIDGGDAWAPTTAYTATPVRQWVINAGQAYVAAENHTSGATFAADLAAGKWFAVDSAQLRADLLASSGSSIVGYLPAGTGAIATTVQDQLRSLQAWTVNVKDAPFYAKGDGTTNDRAAIVAAIAAVSAAGGGRIYFPRGNYLVGSSFTVPSYIIFEGEGKRTSVIKRGFTGDLITSWGAYCGLEKIGIDGQQSTYGAGRGVLMPASTPNSFMLLSAIENFSQACLEFAADAGSTFRAIGCDFYTSGTVGTVGAVKVAGVDTAATSRHFTNCESAGCTLYDINGCNDMYVTGGYTNGLITTANTSKLLMNNVRIGAAAGTVTIYGSSSRFSNCVFAVPVILQCTNTYFHCEVPSYNITDNGTGNDIFQKSVLFTSSWTASGTAPALGNGTITAAYSRAGNLIDVLWDITLGSTSTVGTGTWYFSLPRADVSSPVQMGGSGYCANAASSAFATFICRVEPGAKKVSLWYVDTGGVARNVGDVKPAAVWGAGSVLRFSMRYYTV